MNVFFLDYPASKTAAGRQLGLPYCLQLTCQENDSLTQGVKKNIKRSFARPDCSMTIGTSIVRVYKASVSWHNKDCVYAHGILSLYR